MVTPADAGYARSFPVDGVLRRWRFITLWALVGLLLGGAALFLLPRVYSSTVSVIVQPSLGNPFSPTDAGQSLDNLITEAIVANSTPVAEKVREAVAPEASTKDLRNACAVDRVPNSQILEITCADAAPSRARTIANGFASAYLAYRSDVSKKATSDTVASLTTTIANLRQQLNDTYSKLRVTSQSSASYTNLTSRIQALGQTLTDQETQANQVQLSQADPGSILSPASNPHGGFGLKRLAYPFVGLVVAGMLGLLLAARNALHDDRVHSASDLGAIGPPVLAVPETLRAGGAAMEESAASIVSAAFRGRVGPDRTAVVLTAIGPGVNTVRGALRIVESLRADAFDVALVELASAAARDRDPEAAPLRGEEEALGTSPSRDLETTQGVEPGSEEHDTDAPVYKILADRLERQQFRDLIDRLGSRHELVVIVGQVLAEPATLDAVEAIGDTMLVVPMGQFNETEVRSAVDQVRLFHGRVIALVTG